MKLLSNNKFWIFLFRCFA